MRTAAQRVVRQFKAGVAYQRQLEDLVDKVARTVRILLRPGIDAESLAKGVVTQVLRQDSDGSFLGAVYSDLFDRKVFLGMLTRKLEPHRSASVIAEEILLKLEDQR